MLHRRLIVVLALFFALIAACSLPLYAGWQLVQKNPITIYRDTRTGLDWSVTIANASNNANAQRVVQQYGLRLPTWEEFRDVVNNNGAVDWLDIKDSKYDWYETRDPNVLVSAWPGSVFIKRPRSGYMKTWIIGVRDSSGKKQSQKP